MDNSRMIIAIVLSLIVFVAWEFFFSEKQVSKTVEKKDKTVQVEKETPKEETYKKPTNIRWPAFRV